MSESISTKFQHFLGRLFGRARTGSLKSGKSHRTANILLVILLAISGLATFNGVSAFYGLEDLGSFSFQSNYSLLIVLVFTVLMWYTIDYAVTSGNAWFNRLGFLVMYLMLAVLSVGFGYGLWWNIISAQDSTSKSVDEWVENLKTGVSKTEGEVWLILDQVETMRTDAVSLRVKEEADGGTCGVNWGGSCGPLCNTRKDITSSLERISTSINDSWLTKVKTEISDYSVKVDKQVKALKSGTGFRGGRDEANQKILKMYKNGNRLQASLNAYSEQYSENQASELEDIAKILSVPPTRFGFSCYDPTQSKSLRRLADYLRTPPTLEIKSIQDYSGPNAAKIAIMSLWRWTISSLTGGDLQDLQAIGLEEEYVSAKLRGNDFLALFLTILVDSGIFILTVSRPRRHFSNESEAIGWLNENFVGNDATFLIWFSHYKFDFKSNIFIVRPTTRWSRNKHEINFTVDDIALITGPLVTEGLIKEIEPDPQLLSLSLRHLEEKNWKPENEEADAQIYAVRGTGLSELFSIASTLAKPPTVKKRPAPKTTANKTTRKKVAKKKVVKKKVSKKRVVKKIASKLTPPSDQA